MVKFSQIITSITVILFLWYIFNFVTTVFRLFYPNFDLRSLTLLQPSNPHYKPYWSSDRKFDLTVYTSTFADLDNEIAKEGLELIYKADGLAQDFLPLIQTLPIELKVNSKGKYKPLYLHTFITEPSQDYTTDSLSLYSKTKLLNYNKANKQYKVKGWVQFEIILDRTEYTFDNLPNDIGSRMLLLNPERTFYLPTYYVNDIGTIEATYLNLNASQTQYNLEFKFKKQSLGMSRLHLLFDNSFKQLSSDKASIKISESELDKIRTMLYEVQPTLLLITFIAAFFHLLFDCLAFQSDIKFWNSLKQVTAVSKTSVAMETLSKLISTFYLFDKRDETSNLVIFGSVAATLVDFYKLFRIYQLNPSANDSKLKKEQEYTDQIDKLVLKYTVLISVPITLIYATYTFQHSSYKTTYSWFLEVFVALVYLLGFVTMLPQVVINYKLKTVQSVPLGAFLFRTINTFVDDLFALVIPMPNLSRAAFFRDDLIFFIFLYQWFKYPARKEDVVEESLDEMNEKAKKEQ